MQLAGGKRTSLEVNHPELLFTYEEVIKQSKGCSVHTVMRKTYRQFHVSSVRDYRSSAPPKGELLKDRRPDVSIFIALCLSNCNQMLSIDLNLWQGTYLAFSNSHQSLRSRQ